MSAARFRRVSEWRVPAPRAHVYAVLVDLARIGSWWPDFEDVRLEGGRSARAIVRGPLGSRFDLHLRIVEARPTARIVVRASGDLDGTGVWTLEPDGTSSTRIRYEWNVVVRKRWLALAAPFLSSIFRRSHDAAMARGEHGLHELLRRDARPNGISAP